MSFDCPLVRIPDIKLRFTLEQCTRNLPNVHPGNKIDTLDPMKRLIINADDFGVTRGVNRAIQQLGVGGHLTSATMMAVAAEHSEALSFAHKASPLRFGCHIVLVDGEPALPAAELPTLTDPQTGRFRHSLGKFVLDLFLGRIHATEIEAEADAQITRLLKLDLPLTHFDTHKHTHIFPRVLEPVLQAAKRHGIHAVRNPFEPLWSLDATKGAPSARKRQIQFLNRFRPKFDKLVARSGLATTDGAVGVLATGTLDGPTLAALLHAIPDGTWELVTHPGYNDEDLATTGTRLLSSRDKELVALIHAAMPHDIKLIHFGDLP